MTIQSIPADCIRRTALPESLCVPLAYVHRLHHSQSSSGLSSWENDQGLASFCSKCQNYLEYALVEKFCICPPSRGSWPLGRPCDFIGT